MKDNNNNITSNDNDVNVSYAFVLTDKDGKRVQISNTLTFKSLLEPGMLNDGYKIIDESVKSIGYDYFMRLVRKYINQKVEDVYKNNFINESQVYSGDDKVLVTTDGVNEIIGNNFDEDSIDEEEDLNTKKESSNDNHPLDSIEIEK